MTKQQQKKLDYLKMAILNFAQSNLKSNNRLLEYKQFLVEEIDNNVILTTIIGYKKNNISLKEIFKRKIRIIKISPPGGLTLINSIKNNIKGKAVVYEGVKQD